MIKVHCGLTVESKLSAELHPTEYFYNALEIVKNQIGEDDTDLREIYTNSPDYVTALKDLSSYYDVKCEFYLDGELQDDVEKIFEGFNEIFDLIKKHTPNFEDE